jgi:hypothetical protein
MDFKASDACGPSRQTTKELWKIEVPNDAITEEEKERKLVTEGFGLSSATNINPRVLYNTSYDQYRDLRGQWSNTDLWQRTSVHTDWQESLKFSFSPPERRSCKSTECNILSITLPLHVILRETTGIWKRERKRNTVDLPYLIATLSLGHEFKTST